MRWRLALGVLAFSVAAVPFASGARTVLNASGVIAGTGPTYTLTITNTGTEPIRCFALTAPVDIVSITGPEGWLVGTDENELGGITAGPGIAPGTSVTFTFRTAQPYPPNAGGELYVSATCMPGSDLRVRATGPIVPVTPGSGAKPCACKSLSVKLDGTLLNKAPRIAPDDHDFGVGFTWNMTCTNGAGKCKGTLNFSPPEILAGTLPRPKQNLHLNLKKLAFVCQANCGAGKLGRFEAKMLSREQLKVLFGRTLAYTIRTKCGNTTKTIKVVVSINQNGKLRRVRG